jgi:hypothetical protein
LDESIAGKFTRVLHQTPGGMMTDLQLVNGGISETPKQFDRGVKAFGDACDRWIKKHRPKDRIVHPEHKPRT